MKNKKKYTDKEIVLSKDNNPSRAYVKEEVIRQLLKFQDEDDDDDDDEPTASRKSIAFLLTFSYRYYRRE